MPRTAKKKLKGLRLARRVSALFLAHALWGTSAHAQDPTPWRVAVHGVAAVPAGEFRDLVSDTRWGGMGVVTRRLGGSPLRLGLDLGLLANGSADIVLERRLAPGLDDGRLTNGIYFGHFLARVQPEVGPLAPFIEAAIGVRAYETAIVLDNCLGPCTIFDEQTDTALSMGGGGGVSVRIPAGFAVEVSARYLLGGNAEYYLPEDLPALASDEGVVPARSRTDLFWLSFGIAFEF